MSVTPRKEYVRPLPAMWWLKRRTYFLFMLRELTCVFVGGYALLLLLLAKYRDDPQAFAGVLDSPLLIALQLIALPMILYHSVTWINLTPMVMVLWRGEERVSPMLIAGVNYVAWVLVSVLILWIVSAYR